MEDNPLQTHWYEFHGQQIWNKASWKRCNFCDWNCDLPYHKYAMREVSVNSTSAWNHLAVIQRLQLFVQLPQRYILILPEEIYCVFPKYWLRINEYLNSAKNYQALKCKSSFVVDYFLRYYWMMQHQPAVERDNRVSTQAISALISSLSMDFVQKTYSEMKGGHPRLADQCPIVPRHS